MKPLPPIVTLPLFPELNAALIALLSGLDAASFRKPTIHADRDVKDLTAHLLDGSLRRLALQRDGHETQRPVIQSYEDLVAYIQDLNREWMNTARRLSPRILIQLMKQADEELVQLFSSLDPEGPAFFAVAWAGEDSSAHWFDIAREYTEKWHHQQQIRDAVGRPGLTERRHFHPVLDAFMRGAPRAYQGVDAAEGTLVKFTITGEAGGDWFLLREGGRWGMTREPEGRSAAEVSLDQDLAWRLWTKGLSGPAIQARVQINGDTALGSPILRMVTIMA
jgi:hypothetical protein